QRLAERLRQGSDRALVPAVTARDLESAGEHRRRRPPDEELVEPDGEVAGRPRRELARDPPPEGEREPLEVLARHALGAARETPLAPHLSQATLGCPGARRPRDKRRDGRRSRLCLTSHTPRGVSRTAGRKSAERKNSVKRGSWCE